MVEHILILLRTPVSESLTCAVHITLHNTQHYYASWFTVPCLQAQRATLEAMAAFGGSHLGSVPVSSELNHNGLSQIKYLKLHKINERK